MKKTTTPINLPKNRNYNEPQLKTHRHKRLTINAQKVDKRLIKVDNSRFHKTISSMTLRERGQKIQQQILRDIKYHPNDITKHISQIFSISRQAVNKHLKKLVAADMLEASGSTRNKVYKLGSYRSYKKTFKLNKKLSEHDIYRRDFFWVFEELPKNIEEIIFYGFTEIVNNAIDHSQGTECYIEVMKNKEQVYIFIQDNGEGIFKRITRLKALSDEKQAILELYKGKLTTDPKNHSGQGIFFASKMFDNFTIASYELVFNHHHKFKFDFINDNKSQNNNEGTAVLMDISIDSLRTDKEIFDQFSGNEDENYAFNKTVIPVNMSRIDKENLVSRSQAKRLLSRVDSFKYVAFDFKGVESVGQAFADEIFRVYRQRYPQIFISYQNANDAVNRMIKRAEADLN
ncbi:ATP-binding region, ATPase-like [hydrothermal vent metagenome]|uniref:ATP-binding region, ATPase-like n=1 Tax=hydrothermal vent metagenome TaxID=652676 RepID=A0A3B0W4U5_9ZZZZ